MKNTTTTHKINSLSLTWKILCWFSIISIIIYNFYIVTLTHNKVVLIQHIVFSLFISLLIYIISYTIAEFLQLLEDIKNK